MSISSLRGFNGRMYRRAYNLVRQQTTVAPMSTRAKSGVCESKPSISSCRAATGTNQHIYRMVKKRSLEARVKHLPDKFPNQQAVTIPSEEIVPYVSDVRSFNRR